MKTDRDETIYPQTFSTLEKVFNPGTGQEDSIEHLPGEIRGKLNLKRAKRERVRKMKEAQNA